jgi:hypothetical protein
LISGDFLDIGHTITQDEASAEASEVTEARMGADGDAALARKPYGCVHDDWIAGMPTAGNVGARHYREHGLVIAHLPWPKTLADVRVEINLHTNDPQLIDRSPVARARFSTADLTALRPSSKNARLNHGYC